MLAVKALYKNGNIQWVDKPPAVNAEVMVVFSVENLPVTEARQKMSNDKAMQILNKYAGSIDRDIDYDKERDEYFNEKYGPFN